MSTTPNTTASSAADAKAEHTALVLKHLRVGDVITHIVCMGMVEEHTFTQMDGRWLCGRPANGTNTMERRYKSRGHGSTGYRNDISPGNVTHINRIPVASVAPAAQPADPMDWPLPCAVTVGHGTMHKGVPLRTLVARMKVLYEMATGTNADEVANRTPDQLAKLQSVFLESLKTAQAPPPEPDMRAVAEALGFDPTNRHNAAKCPYCSPAPSTQDAEDAAFEAVRKKLCKLPRYSFVLWQGSVRRVADDTGSWIEFDAAHALFDPVAVDAARAQQEGGV